MSVRTRVGLFTLSLALASTVPLPAQNAAPRPLTIEDYYRVQSVGAVRMAPDGRTVTFTVATRVELGNTTRVETFTVPVDGSKPPAKVEAPPGAGNAGRGGRGGRGGAPGVASPDGTASLVMRDLPRRAAPEASLTDFEKRHMDRFKGAIFDWKDFQRDGQPFPAPNVRARPGQQLVLQADAGGEARPLTTDDLRPAGVTWHPDGKLIAFVADPDWRDELKYESPDLYTVTPDGTLTRVTDDDFVYSGPAFAPDGRYLAYIRTFGTDMVIDQKLNHGGPRDLFVRPVTSGAVGAPINLTANWDLEPGAARFSPDGAFMCFSAGTGGETHLFKVSVPGGEVTQVTRGPRRLAGFSYNAAMTKMAYTATTHDSPGEVYVANIDGSGERQLTHIGAPVLDGIAFGKTERLEWASKDGTRIEGWLTHPAPGTEPAQDGKAPLIVFSHGGPHSATGYNFNFKKQFFAAQGYFILDTNFRSSTGYGEAFKWATWGAWGDKDGEDVMAGIDHVLARYPIDANNVGHTGHSYGGFMTNWLITQYPDRFAAAITGAGITNWISDYGTADIYRTKETEFFGPPWDPAARERMIRQSPLTYADRVRTPTLFVHGEVDQRVPYEEGEQMYFALKRRGVPAKMIQYAGQPHGISGHWNNVHRMLSELEWWKMYLDR